MSRTNLLLHYFPKMVFRSDFDGIADRIHANTTDVSVDVLATDRPHPLVMLRAAARPTVSVEFYRAKFTPCLRGKVFRQWRGGPKSAQYRVMEAAGLPVPKWAPITPDLKLDPAEWGPYVVEKPDLGARGAYVRTRRTGRVRHRSADELEEDNPGRDGGILAQRLIVTGPIPVSYRVQTLFGAPMMAIRYDGSHAPWYTVDAKGQRKLTGSSMVATGTGCEISLCADADILDLARRTHDAFPDVPVLGTDIVRDIDDGSLWVLEVNPDGDTWNLGSRSGQRLMASCGEDFYAQFGALDRAAETLVDLCRKAAT